MQTQNRPMNLHQELQSISAQADQFATELMGKQQRIDEIIQQMFWSRNSGTLGGFGRIGIIVAEVFEIDPMMFRRRCRERRIAEARHALVLIIRETIDRVSFQAISNYLCRTDHATAINSVSAARRLYDSDPIYRKKINVCRAMVKAAKVSRSVEAAEGRAA